MAVLIRNWRATSARELGVPLLPCKVKRFSNDCLEVQLQANCREQDVFLIQTLSAPGAGPPGRAAADAGCRPWRSASRITAVIPHYSYALGQEDQPRISIGGRLVADLLVTAGASLC